MNQPKDTVTAIGLSAAAAMFFGWVLSGPGVMIYAMTFLFLTGHNLLQGMRMVDKARKEAIAALYGGGVMSSPRALRSENYGDRRLVQYDTHWKFECEQCDFTEPFLSEGEARSLLREHTCPAGFFDSSPSPGSSPRPFS